MERPIPSEELQPDLPSRALDYIADHFVEYVLDRGLEDTQHVVLSTAAQFHWQFRHEIYQPDFRQKINETLINSLRWTVPHFDIQFDDYFNALFSNNEKVALEKLIFAPDKDKATLAPLAEIMVKDENYVSSHRDESTQMSRENARSTTVEAERNLAYLANHAELITVDPHTKETLSSLFSKNLERIMQQSIKRGTFTHLDKPAVNLWLARQYIHNLYTTNSPQLSILVDKLAVSEDNLLEFMREFMAPLVDVYDATHKSLSEKNQAILEKLRGLTISWGQTHGLIYTQAGQIFSQALYGVDKIQEATLRYQQIRDSQLPRRVKNALTRSGIKSIDELLHLTLAMLERIKRLDKVGQNDILNFLQNNGLGEIPLAVELRAKFSKKPLNPADENIREKNRIYLLKIKEAQAMLYEKTISITDDKKRLEFRYRYTDRKKRTIKLQKIFDQAALLLPKAIAEGKLEAIDAQIATFRFAEKLKVAQIAERLQLEEKEVIAALIEVRKILAQLVFKDD